MAFWAGAPWRTGSEPHLAKGGNPSARSRCIVGERIGEEHPEGGREVERLEATELEDL